MDVDDVEDRNEIAALLARRKTAAAFKKARAAVSPELAIQLVDHRRHASFICFPRPINVEVAQARDGARNRRQNRPDVIVEDQFGAAVEIEWSLILGSLPKINIRTISRRA